MTTAADTALSRHDAKATQILDAAMGIFIERGYAETSMDHVAQMARVSKTTLYTRFPSKELLFGACVERECERVGIIFDPEELIELPLEEALFRIARAFTEIHGSPTRLRAEQILAAESQRFPEVARVFLEHGPGRSDAAVTTFFRLAAERGLIQADDPGFVAEAFFGVAKAGLCYECELGLKPLPDHAQRENDARRAVHLFLHGILPR
jgi:TetR/AcrR family transcriptional regulator, mexJK operon transcriptional repressor